MNHVDRAHRKSDTELKGSALNANGMFDMNQQLDIFENLFLICFLDCGVTVTLFESLSCLG